MKDRMAASFSQTVRVQKAFPVSRRTATARQPISDFACQAERSDWTNKAGRYRQDRTRTRGIDTKATRLPPRLVGQHKKTLSSASRTGTREWLQIFTTNYHRHIEAGSELARLYLWGYRA